MNSVSTNDFTPLLFLSGGDDDPESGDSQEEDEHEGTDAPDLDFIPEHLMHFAEPADVAAAENASIAPSDGVNSQSDLEEGDVADSVEFGELPKATCSTFSFEKFYNMLTIFLVEIQNMKKQLHTYQLVYRTGFT